MAKSHIPPKIRKRHGSKRARQLAFDMFAPRYPDGETIDQIRARMIADTNGVPIRDCPKTNKPCHDARCARDWCRRDEHYP